MSSYTQHVKGTVFLINSSVSSFDGHNLRSTGLGGDRWGIAQMWVRHAMERETDAGKVRNAPPLLTCPQRGVGLGPPWAGVRSDELVSAAPGVTPSEDCVAFISEEASTQHLEPSRFSKKKKDLTGSALGR